MLAIKTRLPDNPVSISLGESKLPAVSGQGQNIPTDYVDPRRVDCKMIQK